MIARRRAVALAAILLACAAVPAAAQPAKPLREAHGALDAFATDGLALAWAILRGRDEGTTRVVVRIAADPARFGSLSATGVDPFSDDRAVLAAPRAFDRQAEVAVPRARFADHPRSEWRFWREATPAAGAAPALLVYYQGVPDTAPEFDDAARLDAYLAQRLRTVAGTAQGAPR